MTRLELTRSFLTGHAGIDDDHKRIIDIINAMIDCENGGDTSGCIDKMEEFVKALREHFDSEIQIMRDSGYKSVDSHEIEHEEVFKKITDISSTCKNQKGGMDLNYSMLSIFVTNLLKEDLDFRAHLENVGYSQ